MEAVKEREEKMTGKRLLFAAVLFFVAIGIGACGIKPQKPDTGTGEAVTKTPIPTETVKPTETVTPTEIPAPTAAPLHAPQAAWSNTAEFAVVTPVPEEQIGMLAGTMTAEEYPVVDGSTATLPLSFAVYRYMTGATKEEAEQAIVHTKTTNSYYRLYEKTADLLLVYEPSEEIVERMRREGLLIKPIGLDALVFMENEGNPVNSLTQTQLRDIYSGKYADWAEVGGANQPLIAFQRPDGSGSQSLMKKLVMKDTEMATGKNVFRYATMSDVLDGMLSYNGEDNVLAYSVFYYAGTMYRLPDLKFVAVDGVAPSAESIYDGSYPLTNAFYAVIRPDEPKNSNARKIFDWLTGEAGQQLVLELGYVPMRLAETVPFPKTQGTTAEEQTEVLAKNRLQEGEYFAFYEPQNLNSEFSYGTITIYDRDWKVLTRFYHAVMDVTKGGLFTGRYFPVAQIRSNEEGEQVVRYGIYDLKQNCYSVSPRYESMEEYERARGVYLVTEVGADYGDGKLVDGTGAVLLDHIIVDDYVLLRRVGDLYLEGVEVFGTTGMEYRRFYRVYDRNLKLKYCYYLWEEDLPPEEERIAGVTYCLVGPQGALLNTDGSLLLTEQIFLERYGKENAAVPELQLYDGVWVVSEGWDYRMVRYDGDRYFLNEQMELLHCIPEPDGNEYLSCYPELYSVYDRKTEETKYATYDGELLYLEGFSGNPQVSFSWEDASYLVYGVGEEQIFLEEHRKDGTVEQYVLPREGDYGWQDLEYIGEGTVLVTYATEKTVPNPYAAQYPYEAPTYAVKRYVWFYQGRRICSMEGVAGYEISLGEEGVRLFAVEPGEVIRVESESQWEDYCYYASRQLVVLDHGKIRYKTEQPVYQPMLIRGFLQLKQGSYNCVMDYDGTVYLRALDRFFEND